MKTSLKNASNPYNLKNFEDFLSFDHANHSFDNNEEADFLLSNISSPTAGLNQLPNGLHQTLSGVQPPNLLNMSRFEGWTNQPFSFSNEDNYDNTNDVLLKYLNRGESQKNYSTFDDYKVLDYLIGDKNKNDYKADNSSDSRSKDGYFNFDELAQLCDNMMRSDKSPPSEPLKKMDFPSRADFRSNFERRYSHLDHYIREGSGTILKILEASQLWINHTSAEKVPIRLRKQFTKNDNFVVLIRKQPFN
ncbi:conserved hypothetical protein [Theileria orientalis strain Shintoku]|uniref:Uncharacterized protein n=1 Tax=Theileria orientalis strain Shintoku TaxID=869250 RepID=J7MF40_THEOR|nr:conserved hypothetical protein [Theileria orientalis strain Shintoku]BAM42414.1 conserved hypothetical protein [Theileria orientalis strain Shintoku]|eukprot:XP_009692715.1 conserved hypothetical protein [Theileria orientalis strain Shintoku]